MKKVLLVSAVAMLALASCKKEYTCTYDILGSETVIDYGKLDKTDAETAETGCNLVSGTFESK